VSVITPTLNSAEFIRELAQCLEHQDYPHIEHIVVDGGSNDETLAILGEFDTARHRVFVDRDESMYEALNHGLQRCKGELIACLNADDLYFPDTVSAGVALMERHPDVGIVYGDVVSIFMASGSFDFFPMEKAYSDPWGSTLVYITQPAVFMRRGVIDEIGYFDARLRAAADFDYWFRAFRAGIVFRHLPRPLAIVRYHGANLSLSPVWQREHKELMRKYLPGGWRTRFAERYRLLKRSLRVNRLTVPRFRPRQSAFASFSASRYFRYLISRRPSKEPILRIHLPYFQFEAHRALNFDRALAFELHGE
jgi:glycosyltransferase involved in cell wall biosynthesis